MQEIIRVSDVEKYYGNGDQVTKAVDRVSFGHLIPVSIIFLHIAYAV